ncbi:unnamed protein product [Prorocentrum cordatum]|uniref:Uncharacterized protein n=1 Tax=Prorocentrum cordatum TaxID=2364126 RepID=A0ABN9TRX9_9DINO|nr:unnamed protein product [Polarella glacialis]
MQRPSLVIEAPLGPIEQASWEASGAAVSAVGTPSEPSRRPSRRRRLPSSLWRLPCRNGLQLEGACVSQAAVSSSRRPVEDKGRGVSAAVGAGGEPLPAAVELPKATGLTNPLAPLLRGPLPTAPRLALPLRFLRTLSASSPPVSNDSLTPTFVVVRARRGGVSDPGGHHGASMLQPSRHGLCLPWPFQAPVSNDSLTPFLSLFVLAEVVLPTPGGHNGASTL